MRSEVKAGAYGNLKSLELFLEHYKNVPSGFKISEENFGGTGPMYSVPLYTAGNLAAIVTRLR